MSEEYTVQQKIDKLRKAGLSDNRIARYLSEDLNSKKPGISSERINKWLSDKGLPEYYGYDPKTQERPISTITGKPVPTFGEESKARSNLIKKTAGYTLPIIGDIAATAYAPQLKGPQMLKKAFNVLSKVAGSSVGSALGSMAGQKVETGNIDYGEVGDQALMGVLGETAPRLSGKLLKKTWQPITEIASDITYTGAALKNYFRRKLIRYETEKATKFSNEFIGKSDLTKEVLGTKLGEMLKSTKDFETTYAPYKKFVDMAAENSKWKSLGNRSGAMYQVQGPGEIYLDDFAQKFMNFAETLRVSPNTREDILVNKALRKLNISGQTASVIRKTIENGGYIDPRNFEYFFKTFWDKHADDLVETKAFKEELKKTVIGDIGRQSKQYKLVEKARELADKTYADTRQWFRNNPKASRIITSKFSGMPPVYKDTPEKIADYLYSWRGDEVGEIGKVIRKQKGGEDVWAGFEFMWVDNLFRKYISTVEGLQGTGEKFLKPVGLAQEIYDKADWFKKVMPDAWPGLKAEADRLTLLARDFSRTSKAFVTDVAAVGSRAIGGAVGRYFAGGAIGIPIAEGIGSLSALTLMSPKFKKVLAGTSKYILKPALKTTLHLGGRPIQFFPRMYKESEKYQ